MCTRLPEFRKVRGKNDPNSFMIFPELIKRSAWHNIQLIVEILDSHPLLQYSPRSLKRLRQKLVLLCEGINAECWLQNGRQWILSSDTSPDVNLYSSHLILLRSEER